MARHWLLRGALLGAGLMYFFDPQRGARRRALLRDKGRHLLREIDLATRAGARDLGHRAHGFREELRHAMEPGEADAHTLKERVRAELGRACSHASAIEVKVDGARVELSGPVLASEMRDVLDRVAEVRGVAEVASALEPHAPEEHLPALAGDPRRPRAHMRPGSLFLLGTASAAGALVALARGSALGFALGGAGAAAAISGIEHRYAPRAR